jgi:hypothetical protein
MEIESPCRSELHIERAPNGWTPAALLLVGVLGRDGVAEITDRRLTGYE